MADIKTRTGNGLTVEEHLAAGHWTDGKKWFYGDKTIVPIRDTEGEYTEFLPIASQEATKAYRDALNNAVHIKKMKRQYEGSNRDFNDYFDVEKMEWRPGKRPKLNMFDPNFDPDDTIPVDEPVNNE